MKKLKSRLIKIAISVLAIVFAVNLFTSQLLDSSTVYAVGDLSVDWGVPEGNPIFTVTGMVPGQSVSHDVNVTNNGSGIRPVGVRSSSVNDSANLSQAFDFVITESGTDIYGGTSSSGPKTLADFFTEGNPINGIFLSDINPATSITYTFKAIFKEEAGNDFQNTQVIFDIIIGISIDLPDECEQIGFSNSPIFGTSIGDRLKGTSGNDLILGFEGGDSIDGKGGDDCILGGPGGDSIKGGEGSDVILGQESGDNIRGDSGQDTIFGGAGGDHIEGGGHNDKIHGNESHDFLKGDGGEDEIFGDDGNDSLKGGGQNDILIGGTGFGDSANGDGGTDQCEAESENNCELDP